MYFGEKFKCKFIEKSLIVLLLLEFRDLVNAVGIGLILSSILFMKRRCDFTADESRLVTLKEEDNDAALWLDEKSFPAETSSEVFIKHLNGPFVFRLHE